MPRLHGAAPRGGEEKKVLQCIRDALIARAAGEEVACQSAELVTPELLSEIAPSVQTGQAKELLRGAHWRMEWWG